MASASCQRGKKKLNQVEKQQFCLFLSIYDERLLAKLKSINRKNSELKRVCKSISRDKYFYGKCVEQLEN